MAFFGMGRESQYDGPERRKNDDDVGPLSPERAFEATMDVLHGDNSGEKIRPGKPDQMRKFYQKSCEMTFRDVSMSKSGWGLIRRLINRRVNDKTQGDDAANDNQNPN